MKKCQRCQGEVARRVWVYQANKIDEHHCIKCGELVNPDGISITREPDGRPWGRGTRWDHKLGLNA